MFDANKTTGLSSFDVLSIGIKVIGVVLLSTTIWRLVGAIASVFVLNEYAGMFVHPIHEITTVAMATLRILITVVFMFFGDRIARLLCADGEMVSSPRDGLRIAAKLVGIYYVALGIPYILEYLVLAFNIGVKPESMKFSQMLNAANACRYLLPTVIGIYLVTGARHMLDLAYGRIEQVEEA